MSGTGAAPMAREIPQRVRPPYQASARGYHLVYRYGEANACPGCGRSHWYIGRMSAECGFCGTALPLPGGGSIGSGCFVKMVRPQ